MALLKILRPTLLVAILIAGACPLSALEPPAAEEVKAAFLCNFVDFVEWPAKAAEEGPEAGEAVGGSAVGEAAGGAIGGTIVTIGILGEDPFGPLIDQAAEARSVPGREIEVRRLGTLEQAAAVEVLFVGASEEEKLEAILASLHGAHVLTVGDLPGFAAAGGVIGMLVEDKRVRLEINVAAAQRAGLAISSRLLKLARLVEETPPPPPGGEP